MRQAKRFVRELRNQASSFRPLSVLTCFHFFKAKNLNFILITFLFLFRIVIHKIDDTETISKVYARGFQTAMAVYKSGI